MIFISAGHENNFDGANYKEEFFEHEEALRWAEHIVSLDTDNLCLVPVGTLKEKTDFINKSLIENEINAAVEIHFNSAVDSSGNHIGRGSECLHYPESSLGILLAQCIQERISIIFNPDRGIKEGWYHGKTKKVDYFLRATNCPATIVEPEFIQFHERIQLFREKACKEIYRGILNFISY